MPQPTKITSNGTRSRKNSDTKDDSSSYFQCCYAFLENQARQMNPVTIGKDLLNAAFDATTAVRASSPADVLNAAVAPIINTGNAFIETATNHLSNIRSAETLAQGLCRTAKTAGEVGTKVGTKMAPGAAVGYFFPVIAPAFPIMGAARTASGYLKACTGALEKEIVNDEKSGEAPLEAMTADEENLMPPPSLQP
ncbi:MAG: hypothetical protein K0Q74_677 [Gammaproteobacteria bacterium]|jgi:hypothetical protein|nr:hypothetical protein [Gammaproteobacteria bacterium]